MARVQLEFITKGWEPQADRAQRELGWQPLSLRQGIQKYLKDRMNLPRQD
jgi:nucleoside-diphosphate-sugar epimerase